MNAKQELLGFLKATPAKLIALHIEHKTSKSVFGDGDDFEHQETTVRHTLLPNHDRQAFDDVLQKLDFNYDNGYGCQELYGVLWFDDGSWAERGEYDGSEWWEMRQRPPLPKPPKGKIISDGQVLEVARCSKLIEKAREMTKLQSIKMLERQAQIYRNYGDNVLADEIDFLIKTKRSNK